MTGVALREEALEGFEGRWPLDLLRERAKEVALSRADRTASINDVRPLYDSLPYGGTPNILGAVFRGKKWEIVHGIEQQTEPAQGHARRVRVFRFVGEEK